MLPRAAGGDAITRRFGADAADARMLMVLVHPGSLPVTSYSRLAAVIPAGTALIVADLEQVPEYWEGALRGGAVSTSVGRLAARVAAELPADRSARLLLAGWSFGGVVAHALATAVDAERIVLLDSIAPVDAFADAEETLDDGEMLRWFAMYLGAKRGRRLMLQGGVLDGMSAVEGLAVLLDVALTSGVLRPGTTLAGLRKVYETYLSGLRRNQRLALDHAPTPARAPLHLIKPGDSLLPDSPALGWEKLAGAGLAVHRCGGNHYTMVEDPAAVGLVARLLATDDQLGAPPLVGANEGGLR